MAQVLADPLWADLAKNLRAQREKEASAAREAQAREAKKPDILLSLPEFLKSAHGLTQEEAELALTNGMFSLYPSEAPLELRQRVFEAKIEKERRLELEARQQEQQVQKFQQFQYEVATAARKLSPESHPESDAFYGDDPEAYEKALNSTAYALAEDATKRGAQADLSVANLQRIVEETLAKRLSSRDKKRTSRKPVEEAPTAPTPEVPFTAVSSVGVSAGGRAAPKKFLTSEEAAARFQAILLGKSEVK